VFEIRVLFLSNVPAPYRVDFFNELGKTCDLTILFERYSASDRHQDWAKHTAVTFKPVCLPVVMVRHDSAFCPSVLWWLTKKTFDDYYPKS